MAYTITLKHVFDVLYIRYRKQRGKWKAYEKTQKRLQNKDSVGIGGGTDSYGAGGGRRNA